MRAVVDNDILLKGACYGLLAVIVGAIPGDGAVGVLGASRFVVPQRIMRTRLIGSATTAKASFAAFLAQNEVVEPTTEEQRLPADLEATAQKMALNLDAGESQLVAILVSRCLPWLLTGDKRAITAIDLLLDTDARLKVVTGRIKCLEQLVADALVTENKDEIRGAICAEPHVDVTLSICFSCGSSGAADATEGLNSYIGDLRTKAGRVLAI